MRLTKIKLSGFKSFVDPTTFQLPSTLVGIVGPNGCGKSNLIDAVRWVMGESSAKQLRGESMADVIFNGSSARKPVGLASIELVFDNSDRRVAGQYAGYDEIGIRRILQRDGQSAYYLNGTRCRRRDITDIFLGTGLGPRSYSIIEQGMISRVIEAGPEQLRGFLEEAAGISKYKERRRETENRIRHARENLSRVNDLRDELGRQLDKLQRQARNAERYRELKQQERRLKAGVLALRWAAEQERRLDLEAGAAETQLELDRLLAAMRSVEARIEKGRYTLSDANDALSAVQGRYYGAESQVSRVEQTIKHGRELRARHEDDLQRTESALEDLLRHADADRRHIAELESFLTTHEPELVEAREAEASARQRNDDAEGAQTDWRTRWDSLQQRLAQRQRDTEVTHARIDHGEGQLADMVRRLDILRTELRELSGESHDASIAACEARVRELDSAHDTAKANVARLEQVLRQEREALEAGENELHAIRERLESDQGRESSLKTLQRAALNQDEEGPERWLASLGLERAERLADTIRAESGWEAALESTMSGRLNAVCVHDVSRLASETVRLSAGRVTLFQPAAALETADEEERVGLVPLERQVRSSWPLRSLLGGVYIADGIESAVRDRGKLRVHESFVTPDGTRIGPDWLERNAGDEPSRGVLARARELEEVARSVAIARDSEVLLQDRLGALRASLDDAEVRLSEELESLQRLRDERAHVSAEALGFSRRAEQASSRRGRIETEIRDLEEQHGFVRSGVAESRATLERMVSDLADASAERERLVTEGGSIDAALAEWRKTAREARMRVHDLSVRVESRRSSLESLRRGLSRLDQQRESLETRREELSNALASGEQPQRDAERDLERALRARAELESELAGARDRVASADAEVRSLDAERNSTELSAEGVRDTLERRRVAIGEAGVRCQNLVEQLAELSVTPEQARADLPAEADITSWQSELDGVGLRIQRLGAINLAAIDEFAREKERKDYLDAQHDDLNEALETLEAAIAKIDTETRTRFQEVYQRVNDGFGELFPRLFGGGQAFLEMVGQDALDAGVAVMARPPGKRISNIHLLSGGEKALTAAALVFAIFQLNPAPFCMLDEVDAPLDEANVGRFCDLVREMSSQVQFIVITHNKTTMEVLDQLVGVTMHEPGCSRLVAVDVDEAVRLAAV